MVYKECPDCKQWIPVACKKCPCGHVFSGRKTSSSEKPKVEEPNTSGETIQTRRTERTKRQRPDFFNALEFESHMKKVSRSRTLSSRSEEPVVEKKKDGRGRPKGSTKQKTIDKLDKQPEIDQSPSESLSTPSSEVDKSEDDNTYANLPADKVLQYSIILSELNNKYKRQNFQPT